MATNSRSNTIVEQMSATNQCLRTAPILRRILGGSLPCDIWRCFQQIACLKARPNDQLVLHILYSCCISMVHRPQMFIVKYLVLSISFCMQLSPLKPSTDDLFWRGIWCPAMPQDEGTSKSTGLTHRSNESNV